MNIKAWLHKLFCGEPSGTLAALAPAITTVRTSVTAAIADTVLLGVDMNRGGVTVFNDSTAVCYVGYGSDAVSTTNYSDQLAAGAYLVVPDRFTSCALHGYWAAVNGAARITAA